MMMTLMVTVDSCTPWLSGHLVCWYAGFAEVCGGLREFGAILIQKTIRRRVVRLLVSGYNVS